MPRLLKSGHLSEDSIHKAVVEFCMRHPLLRRYTIHAPNEGKRNPRFGAKLKSMGMRKGVWDIQIPLARKGYIGLFVEIKSLSGRLTKEQVEFQLDMEEAGHLCLVHKTIEGAIKAIKEYID